MSDASQAEFGEEGTPWTCPQCADVWVKPPPAEDGDDPEFTCPFCNR